ncbi:GNAT family N-acetyltransferase [Clostridium sp. Marseille-Q2269]|uniref:GNAT family N-acetyltransferase n=1 Tax=Clostridium sp. Marseille-Q2269 TaxID=2942205 RepID=UPI00207433D1|nr:GNAT family N-acetyltransferase [Clostridium sp. Marseille-Q2269]
MSDLYEELIGEKTNGEKMGGNFNWMNSNENYMLIGAKDDRGNLLGSLLGIVCRDIAGECRPFMVVENVIVKSIFRGLGIGRELMKFIEDYGSKRAFHYIMFVSSKDRKEAHKFYESVGYYRDVVQGFKKYL